MMNEPICVFPLVKASPRRVSRTLGRWLLAASVALAAGSLAGCPSMPPVAPTKSVNQAVYGPAPLVGAEPAGAGVFLPLPHAPLSAEALAKARLDRVAIVAEVNRPPTTTARPATAPARQSAAATGTAPATQAGYDRNAEPPALAIKYYLQGRERFLEGANSEAMDYLDKSLGLDPEAFTVLRLMGRVCFASNQLARGNFYLQRAQALRPGDVEVNYLLGRYFLETKEWPRAIHYLLLADESPERSPSAAQTPLVSFHLARAFQSAGYFLAAAHEYEDFLRLVSQPLAAYRYDRELNFLVDEQWGVDLAAAENYALVGDYAQALGHYQAAASDHPDNHYIAGRLIAAEAQVGNSDQAIRAALKLLGDAHSSEPAVALLVWTYRAAGREAQMLPDLRQRLESSPDKAAAAQAMASVLDRVGKAAEALAVLQEYQKREPGNLAIAGALLTRLDQAGDYWAALSVAGRALAAAPEKSDEIVKLFGPLMDTPGIDAHSPPGRPAGGYEKYVYALSLRLQDGASSVVASALQDAVKAQGDFQPAREAYIEALLAAEQFKPADALIEQTVAQARGVAGAKPALLQVESQVAQHRYSDALKLAKEAKAAFPRSTDLRMAVVAIYRLRGQNAEADAELLATIAEFPKFELAYRRLIDSYIVRGRREGKPDFYLGDAVTCLGGLIREVPGSRFAQTATALLYARMGQLQKSEELFQRLLEQDPSDPEIVVPLAQVRYAQGRRAPAMAVLQAALQGRPTPAVVDAIADFNRDQGQTADALAVSADLLKAHPDNEAWWLLQASELLAQSRREDAEKLLGRGVEKFPKSQGMATTYARALAADYHADEAVKAYQAFIEVNGVNTARLYLLSSLQSQAGQDAAAESSLLRVLAIIPDHTGANNDLGYFWIDAGKKLAEATAMVRKALVNEPNNSAFLDSLGWACYKQAQFNDAVRYLTQAVSQPGGMEPELLSHLGDALYRTGKTDLAVERWTQAQALLAGMPKAGPKLKDYLERVLQQTRQHKSPELAPVGVGVKIAQEL